MEFFTVLIITYGFAEKPAEARIIYTSEQACGTGLLMVDELIDPMLDILMAQCERTGIISMDNRPVARPEIEG